MVGQHHAEWQADMAASTHHHNVPRSGHCLSSKDACNQLPSVRLHIESSTNRLQLKPTVATDAFPGSISSALPATWHEL
jgi:hypothetical protein